jgi:hypothetical protein
MGVLALRAAVAIESPVSLALATAVDAGRPFDDVVDLVLVAAIS